MLELEPRESDMAGKRVLILLQNEPVPSDRHVWNQSTALARAGYDVTVVCPAGEQRDRRDFDELEGVAIHRYEPRRAGERATDYALEYLAALWSIRRLARSLARERPFDLVHACSPPDFLLLAALGLRRRGSRFIFDHHDLTPGALPDPLRRWSAAPGDAAGRADRIPQRRRRAFGQRLLPSRRDRARRARPRRCRVVSDRPRPDALSPTEPDPALKRGKRFLLSYVGVMGAAGRRRPRPPRPVPSCGRCATTGTPSSWATATSSTRCARWRGELGPGRLRRVHRLGRARHDRPGPLELGRVPRAGPEEPAQ